MIWPRKQKLVLKELSVNIWVTVLTCLEWRQYWRVSPATCGTGGALQPERNDHAQHCSTLGKVLKTFYKTPAGKQKLQEKKGGYFPLTDWLGSSPKVTFFAFWFAYHPVDQNSAHLGQYLLTFKCDQIVQGQITLGFLNCEFSSIPFVLPGNLPWYPACSPWHAGSCISRWHSLSPRN